MEKKRFCFVLYTEFRQNYRKEKAVINASACRISTPDKGNIDIRSRRGSGLFISERAFGDALYKIDRTSSCAFLCLHENSFLTKEITKGTCVTCRKEENKETCIT